jgi:SCP-2 sterol transfer family
MPSEHQTRVELAAGFADDPVLLDFLAPINISSGGSIEETIERIAAAVRWTRPSAVVRFTILQPAPARSWSLDLSRKGCSVGESRDDVPDLEILTTPDVFQKMFGGELAPLQAFGQGRMRVRGSLEVARALVRNLRGL